MRGNSLNWISLVILVALAAALVYFLAFASGVTPPTALGMDPRTFAPIVLPQPPAQALGQPADAADAGDLYRQAIDEFTNDRALYEDFAAEGTLDQPQATQLAAIDFLVAASSRAKMNLFAQQPDRIINYQSSKPPLEALETLGRVCIDRLGLLNARAKHFDAAMRYDRAGLVLGWHLANERLTLDELSQGLALMSKSSAAMASLADQNHDPSLAATLRDFDAKRLDVYNTRIEPIARILHTIDPTTIGQHTGDMFVIAKNAHERMWRVEAILALGRVRFLAGAGGTSANQRAATALVTSLADHDADPVIRTAAKAARDLTVQQHRMQ